MLVFFTATLFMTIVDESGGVVYVVRATLRAFGDKRVLALLVLMVIVLIPGALTGAGSVSLLVVGAPVAMALTRLGIGPKRVAAILFIVAGLSAAAPPVNIWAMILCAGTAIPYVGFEFTLGIPVLLLGAFTVLVLGLKKEAGASAGPVELPEPPPGMTLWRVLVPFLVFFGLVAAYRIWPFATPILGLSLEFVIAAAAALLFSPKRIAFLPLARSTVREAPAASRDHGRRRHAPADHDRDRRPGPGLVRRHLHAAPAPVLPAAGHHPLLRGGPDLRRRGHHRHPADLVPGFDRVPRDGRHRRAEPALAPRRRAAADGPDRPAQQHGLRLQGDLPGLPQGHLAALAGRHRRGHGHDRLQREAGLPGQVEHVGMRGTLR
ncbi:MAG: hypothetical protein M0C28_27195 [Candidatus Moduliflexus flocculans]|nr:hypothetical protein [Candidatus Moduliflexus flocculans]